MQSFTIGKNQMDFILKNFQAYTMKFQFLFVQFMYAFTHKRTPFQKMPVFQVSLRYLPVPEFLKGGLQTGELRCRLFQRWHWVRNQEKHRKITGASHQGNHLDHRFHLEHFGRGRKHWGGKAAEGETDDQAALKRHGEGGVVLKLAQNLNWKRNYLASKGGSAHWKINARNRVRLKKKNSGAAFHRTS